jgi:tetratricopeptide (TPR) repeat protein
MNSFLERHARSVLALIGAASISILLLLAMRLGIFGEALSETTKSIYTVLAQTYRINDLEFTVSTGILGGLSTLAGAVYSITKGIYFARRSLPHRLREFLERDANRVIKNRRSAQAIISTASTDLRVGRKSLYIGRVDRSLREIADLKFSNAFNSLGVAIDEFSASRLVLDAKIASLNVQASSAHLLRAVLHIANAQQSTEPDHKHYEAAEKELLIAHSLSPRETDILELHASTLRKLNRIDDALQTDKKIVEAVDPLTIAMLPHTASQAAVAYHNLAQSELNNYFEVRSTDAALSRSADAYLAAVRCMEEKQRLNVLSDDERTCLAFSHFSAMQVYDMRREHHSRTRSTSAETCKANGLKVLVTLPSVDQQKLQEIFGVKLPTAAHSPALR